MKRYLIKNTATSKDGECIIYHHGRGGFDTEHDPNAWMAEAWGYTTKATAVNALKGRREMYAREAMLFDYWTYELELVEIDV